MKISELVARLEKLRGYHGDLDVRLASDDGQSIRRVKVEIEAKGIHVILSNEAPLSPDRN